MSFTRFHDDPNRIHKANIETAAMCDYNFNVPSNFKNTNVYFDDPNIRLQSCGGSLYNNMIDFESKLRCMDRQLNRDFVKEQYSKPELSHRMIPIYNVKKEVTDESRRSHPAWSYRVNCQFRPEHLFSDPQKNAIVPFEHNLDTNLTSKDNYTKNVKKI